MLNAKDIFVLGYFGYDTNQLDGQTVKTREIHKLFEKNTGNKVRFFDTERLKKSRLNILLLLIQIMRIRVLVYLPAQNNLKHFFPILYPLSRLLGFKIHYFVVGGWLPTFIQNNPDIGFRLKNIYCIYVETNDMLSSLTLNHGFNNAIWFPNFRVDHQAKRNVPPSEILRMVFLSRITLEKGIDTIFAYLDSIINEPIYKKVSIDLYGPIDPVIEQWFQSEISKHVNTRYNGQVAPEFVQSTLSNFDLMLFPTRYPGEGCPGAIIDAYMASIPVIASNWRYNSEFVKNNETGFLFEPGNLDQLTQIIRTIVSDRSIVTELSKNAKEFSKKYMSEKAWMLINLS
jgi:glycosyltransferase involved in cell wall biosynthesis